MHNKFDLNVVLVAPEIPGNTGSIGRTCIALNARLILIKPYGFSLDEKAVRRAGLDYWKHVNLSEFDTWDDFLSAEKPEIKELFLFSKFAKKTYFEAEFTCRSYLIFGSETKGLPDFFHQTYKEQLLSLPIYSEHVRSLNLSNAATAACYEALRQVRFQ